MERKRIICLHPSISSLKEFLCYFQIRSKELSELLEWDDFNPKYVFVTEHIYKNKKIFKKFHELYKDEARIFIYHAGEAAYPDLTIFDYAIVINRELYNLDRLIRIPPSIFYERSTKIGMSENTLSLAEAKKELLKKEEMFCNFIYSNPVAHPMRDNIFFALSNYKRVDSLGKYLNNTGAKSTRREKNWGELSVKMKSNYKFTIASENALFDGYTSEKLLTTFQAHSIPIYWGNPYVEKEFNERAFINCHKYISLDEVVKKVKEVDENDDLWLKMVTEPWQTKDQLNTVNIDMKKYDDFLIKLFCSPLETLRRRPKGTFSDIYSNWFFRKYNPPNRYVVSALNLVRRYLKHADKR